MPTTPCTEIAPTGSSILSLSSVTIDATTSNPPTPPISVAASGDGVSGSAVIATSPARAPFSAIVRSALPNQRRASSSASTSPPAAAMLVFTNTSATELASPTSLMLQFRSTVEAEPAEPQYQRAERCQRQVAARDGVDLAARTVFALAGAEQQTRRPAPRTRRTGARCRNRRNRGSQLLEPAAAPFPEALHRVDKAREDDRERKNDQSFMRSATAPETIDMAVATNTTWKKKSDRFE